MNNTIIKFNTAYGSSNMGDFIINESANRELNELFSKHFVVEYPTHTPVSHFYQTIKENPVMKNCNNAKFKFLCGTNILAKNMFRPWPNWNTNISNCKPYRGVVLVGCGLNGDFEKANFYTKLLYRKILSKEYTHSTRDERTKTFLENMGYKAINTGCPTIWSLTSSHCKDIPNKKGKIVVFTLTDYCKDIEADRKMINILRENYDELYYWVQGSGDYDYLNEVCGSINDISLLYGLDAYKEVLSRNNIDYVGTRLHAGIYAMQHKRRSIIVCVDNRARDMRASYNIPTIERCDIDQLDEMIKTDFATDIRIEQKRIEEWKKQFAGGRNGK